MATARRKKKAEAAAVTPDVRATVDRDALERAAKLVCPTAVRGCSAMTINASPAFDGAVGVAYSGGILVLTACDGTHTWASCEIPVERAHLLDRDLCQPVAVDSATLLGMSGAVADGPVEVSSIGPSGLGVRQGSFKMRLAGMPAPEIFQAVPRAGWTTVSAKAPQIASVFRETVRSTLDDLARPHLGVVRLRFKKRCWEATATDGVRMTIATARQLDLDAKTSFEVLVPHDAVKDAIRLFAAGAKIEQAQDVAIAVHPSGYGKISTIFGTIAWRDLSKLEEFPDVDRLAAAERRTEKTALRAVIDVDVFLAALLLVKTSSPDFRLEEVADGFVLRTVCVDVDGECAIAAELSGQGETPRVVKMSHRLVDDWMKRAPAGTQVEFFIRGPENPVTMKRGGADDCESIAIVMPMRAT